METYKFSVTIYNIDIGETSEDRFIKEVKDILEESIWSSYPRLKYAELEDVLIDQSDEHCAGCDGHDEPRYVHDYFHPGPQDCQSYDECYRRAYGAKI